MVHYTLYPVTDYIGIGITECTVDRSELGPRDKILTDVPDVAEDYVNLLGVNLRLVHSCVLQLALGPME